MTKVFNKYLELEEIAIMRKWFLNNGVKREYSKDEYFVCEGDPSLYIGNIESGSFRYVKWTNKGQEQIVGYSFENDFVCDYGSFQTITNAVVSAQAIRDSTVWVINYDQFNCFFNACGIDNLRSNISVSLFSDIYNRLLSFYVDSPEERYLKLITNFPDILNLVNLKEVASYIRVTPETLSRIRKRTSSK